MQGIEILAALAVFVAAIYLIGLWRYRRDQVRRRALAQSRAERHKAWGGVYDHHRQHSSDDIDAGASQ